MAKTFLLTVAFASTLLMGSVTTAAACTQGVNCNQPTGVGKGKTVPVWEVLYCFIGPATGEHEVLPCQDPRAVHKTPTGTDGVCFMGSDGKPHWDYQWAVHKKKRFINQCVANCGTDSAVWQPNWK